jgi:hypothetical protein
MTVDHIGLILYPNIILLRVIGRLSFPLFAFLIAYGCTKTRNISMYFLRLIAFAVWIQILWTVPNFFISGFTPAGTNIFFTLAFGVLAILVAKYIINSTTVKTSWDKFLLATFACMFIGVISLLGNAFKTDYGTPGVLLISLFWAMFLTAPKVHFLKPKILKIIAPALILAVFNAVFMFFFSGWLIQWYSMAAVVIIWFFKDVKIKSSWFEKYFFYLYFPAHFCVLYLISLL